MDPVVIIGGGASGLAAAIAAAEGPAPVTLFERQGRVGRKLAATGNGRCNFSHRNFTFKNFHGAPTHFLRPALTRYDESDTLDFFRQCGLVPYCDERDRYYPASLTAGAVVDVLRFKAAEAGVEIVTACAVEGLAPINGGFRVETEQQPLRAGAVVVATGGAAAPQLGGSESGYALLQSCGHHMVPVRPGIVQLTVPKGALRGLRGLHWDVTATFGEEQESGELLFTDYGLSGPVIFQLSSAISRALSEASMVNLQLDLLPDWTEAALQGLIETRLQLFKARPLSDFFVGFLPRPLAAHLWRVCQIGPQSRLAGELSLESAAQLAKTLKTLNVAINGTRNLRDAQVTIGGIDSNDFNPDTLGSWLLPGLFACGEVLNVDGDCGGYNLQWAWSSGRLAGASAAAWAADSEKSI